MKDILLKKYRTSEVARMVGVHPNTVRLYESYELIPKPQREKNGYRVFTQFHVDQMMLARKAMEVEILQNGLRKKAIEIIKQSARQDFDQALALCDAYIDQILKEKQRADEALSIVKAIQSGQDKGGETPLTRKEAARHLEITIDTLRNWELNGLLKVKRRDNGYRVYTEEDIRLLKIIRALRGGNYSLTAILRLINAFSQNQDLPIEAVLDTPGEHEDIVTACDRLISSLTNAETNARSIRNQLYAFKENLNDNPTL